MGGRMLYRVSWATWLEWEDVMVVVSAHGGHLYSMQSQVHESLHKIFVILPGESV